MTEQQWLSPLALLKSGPPGLVKSLERLLWHLGFSDVRAIDGAGDRGADVLAIRDGREWVFQSKWSKNGPINASGVNELAEAFAYYRADQAVLVTNTQLSGPALSRTGELERIGLKVSVWNGDMLSALGSRMSDRIPPRHGIREYQEKAVLALERDLEEGNRALLILATGLGKTVVGGKLIGNALRRAPRTKVLVLSHLKELSSQLEREMWPHISKAVNTGLLTGSTKPVNFDGVLSATIESALNFVYEGYRPDLVMIDEAHHVGEFGMYEELLSMMGDIPVFGVTATPWRGDEFDLSGVFGEPSYTMGIAAGMAEGYLSDVDYQMFVDNIDWEVVRDESEYGYSIKELNKKLFLPQRDAEIIDELRRAWIATLGPRCIVFCSTIDHAEEFAALLRRSDPAWSGAAALHSGMSQQQRNVMLNYFKLGRTPILTCVDVLNEGVDVPDVNIIAFLRVTHSRRIFVQQLGRGLRLASNKDSLKVLDFVTDVRRVAATISLQREFDGEAERLSLAHAAGPGVSFSDETSGSLLELWLQDAADVESASDEVRLQFPPHLL